MRKASARERERETEDAADDIVSSRSLASGEHHSYPEFMISHHLRRRRVRRDHRGRRLPEEVWEELGDLICITETDQRHADGWMGVDEEEEDGGEEQRGM